MYLIWLKVKPILLVLFVLLSFYFYYMYAVDIAISRDICRVEGVQYNSTVTGNVKNYIVSCNGDVKQAGTFLNEVKVASMVEVRVKNGYFNDDVTIVSIIK